MSDNIEEFNVGSSFESFLKDEGIFEETKAPAVKQVIAFQLRQVMEQQKITKVEMARRLDTSRAQLDRLLDPDNEGVTLGALNKAAHAVGRTIKLELI